MSNTEVIPYAERLGALSVQDVRAQVSLIQHVMREVMIEGQHYGKIPGTDKPTLFKAGAEKLNLTFRFDPQYETVEKQDGHHLTITSKCTLYHIPTGQRFGSGMGSCSTRESKYAYRQAQRKCPKCGKAAIIKGKEEFGGGWVCFKKKDGCGAKFADDAQEIISQEAGRVPNEDVADQYNTVLKMANKRSLVAAVLNTTAASDIFTQDVEDYVEPIVETKQEQKKAANETILISPDQAVELEDVLKSTGRSRDKLLERVSKLYGKKITLLGQIKAEDYEDAMRYAQGR